MNDFLIIGGGMAGCATAARLSALGTVCVLEMELGLGYHATGRSAALFEENYGSRSTIALNRASRAHLEQAGVLSPRGFLMVAHADERTEFEASKAELHMDDISLEEARAKIPIIADDIDRAAYFADAHDIDVDRLLQSFAKIARENGAQIVTKSPVTAITRLSNGWQVTTPAGTHQGRIIINAAGAWVDRVAAMAGITPIGFTPYRRSMARIPAPRGLDIRAWPMLFGPGETWYAKPDAGKLLVSPADEDLVDPQDAWADDMVLAEGIARYQAHVSEPVTRVETSWAGLRTFAPDRSLVIGFSDAADGFFWVAGMGGYGIQSSAGYSQLAADLIAGNAPVIDARSVAELSPSRFN